MTAIDFILPALASLGLWRLWNHEDIFRPARQSLMVFPWLKPAWCSACNAWWIGLAVTLLWVSLSDDAFIRAFMLTMAIYPVIRYALLLQDFIDRPAVRQAPPRTSTPASCAKPTPAPIEGDRGTEKKGCTSCAQRKNERLAEQNRLRYFKRRVVLMTLLGDWNPSYSLVTVILGQARMLAMNQDWLVVIFVQEGCDMKAYPADMPKNVEIRPVMPRNDYGVDQYDESIAKRIAASIQSSLIQLGNGTIITHDLLFIAHYINHAAAIHLIGQTPAFAWLHMAHSAAANVRPTGASAAYRASLPDGHRLICLSPSDAPHLAAYYQVGVDRVDVFPNARDAGDWHGLTPMARRIASEHYLDGVDIVQVFPLSGPRMESKGLPAVILIFAALVRMGFTVRLVVVDAHSNGPDAKGLIARMADHAKAAGLPEGSLIVTSREYPATAATGLTQQDIAGLMRYSNLFVFPTVSEASPLAMMEAVLAGCLVVANASVPALSDIVPHDLCLTYPFGGDRESGSGVSPTHVAQGIAKTLEHPVLLAKRRVLREHSYIALGRRLREIVEALPQRRPGNQP